MKRLLATIILTAAFNNAQAGVYKCGNHYQAKPCDTDNPDAGQVNIKQQTEEQKAASAERLQQIRSEYETSKQQRAEDEEKAFERNAKIAEIQAAQQNAHEQARQADALEQEAAKPVPFMLPPGFNQVIPPRR